MAKLLFVCLGNICRSTMAEAVMRHKIKKAGLETQIQVDSAGTASYHTGEPPHPGTRKVLDREGIDWSGISSRKITKKDLEEFDYIIAMDSQNLRDIRRIRGERFDSKLHLLSDFAPGNWRDVPDPWYTGDFQQTFRLVEEGCAGLLQSLF